MGKLVNKKAMNITLAFDTIDDLNKMSKETGIPKTVIVERALKKELEIYKNRDSK